VLVPDENWWEMWTREYRPQPALQPPEDAIPAVVLIKAGLVGINSRKYTNSTQSMGMLGSRVVSRSGFMSAVHSFRVPSQCDSRFGMK
jgi:hypothetical protein